MELSLSSRSPLLLKESTGEPYLQLPSPHDNIIITPPRTTDTPSILYHMSDFKVFRWLQGPPQPYLPHHASGWLSEVKKASDDTLQELAAEPAAGTGQQRFVGHCPVRTLREVQPDGSDIMLGDIGLRRCAYPDVQDSEKRKRLTDENEQRAVGDPGIVWCIGDYLASSHHGRGVMSAAVATIITQWMIPRMGACLIRVEAFKGNIGSVRVFEKNGFVVEETVDFEQIISSGEKMTGMHILWWRASRK